jgi:hypothetical protein
MSQMPKTLASAGRVFTMLGFTVLGNCVRVECTRTEDTFQLQQFHWQAVKVALTV